MSAAGPGGRKVIAQTAPSATDHPGKPHARKADQPTHRLLAPSAVPVPLAGWTNGYPGAAEADLAHDLSAHPAGCRTALQEEKQKLVEDFWLALDGITRGDACELLKEQGREGDEPSEGRTGFPI